MLKSGLLNELQDELSRHDFSHFVDEPPSIAQGGNGTIVSGCPTSKKRINTMSQFLDHIRYDAMPALVDRLIAEAPTGIPVSKGEGVNQSIRS